MGREALGGGKVFPWLSLAMGEYLGIYRPKNRVRRPAGDPQARGAPIGRALQACGLLAGALPLLQVFWVSSGPRKIIPEILFCLDYV